MQINAGNFSSDSTTCFIGSDSADVVIKAATGKWHFYLPDVSNIRLGFKSLTLLGDRPSNTGGNSLSESLVAMQDVIISNCGLYGVLLRSPPPGGNISGHFTNVTFIGNTRAVELTYTGTTQAAVEFYGTTNFLGNKDGIGIAGPGMSLTNAKATFHGPATFKDNIADPNQARSGGAIFAYIGSEVTFKAPVEFTGNQGGSAGAIFLGVKSILLAEDSATFENNTAVSNYGGGITLGTSTAVFLGRSSFANNVAGVSGGAIYAVVDSEIAFVGPVVLKHNQAGSAGGIYLDHSDLVTNSSCKMDGNAAVNGTITNIQAQLFSSTHSTGTTAETITALSAMADRVTSSPTRWSMKSYGHGTMPRNAVSAAAATASSPQAVRVAATDAPAGSGGAILLNNQSLATFNGPASFTNNKAVAAGGVLLFHSGGAFNGPVTFKGNKAQLAGAVFAAAVSFIQTRDTVLFEDNKATKQAGGAMFSILGVAGIFEKRVTFRGNSAPVSTGGAIAAGDGTLLTFKALAEFRENSADKGGAVALLASSTSRITADSMHLIRNKATNGGGLLSDSGGDGATVSVGDLVVSHNTAEKVGGGMVIGAELVVTGDAKFTGNTAGESGGGVTVIGSMTLHKACFIGNKALAGAALTVAGRVDFNTTNGLQNFHHNEGPNGSEASTISITPYSVAKQKASITCDGANPRPADSKSGLSINVEGPLCDDTSCPSTANNCSCPSGTHFMVAPCSCGSSAMVQVTLTARPTSIVVGGEIKFTATLSAQVGTATIVRLTVDLPKTLQIRPAPAGEWLSEGYGLLWQ